MTAAPHTASEKTSGSIRRIAVAGASGFIGTALCPRLAEHYPVRALTRSPARAARASEHPKLHWEHCDLFSAEALRHGLRDIDIAVYLVHSQAPSSRLTQAQPRDMDLILADNFAQAAAAKGVRQILFVSGLLPQGFEFAPLLWNRREVEMVLAARGTPVTALRASLVVGPGGSGPALLIDLVRRLPLMLLPPSARSLTRPIALDDLIRALLHCLGRPEDFAGAFDIGGADCLSYAEMLRTTSEVLGRKRHFIPVPWLPRHLAALTARWASGAPPALVGAIVESLPESTQIRDNSVQRAIAPHALSFRAALQQVLAATNTSARQTTAAACAPSAPQPRTGPPQKISPRQPARPTSPRAPWQPADQSRMREQSLVRSIQRILTPPGLDAAWVAGNYFRWLGRCCLGLIRTHEDQAGHWTVSTRWPHLILLRLELQPEHSNRERRVYRIAGGLLARSGTPGQLKSQPESTSGSEPWKESGIQAEIQPTEQPRFEFHSLLNGRYTMAAIHDYAPALPWPIYRLTQAPMHLWVMRRYQNRLARLVSAR
ncbi:Putative NADH-flavin reductase [Thiorhodovibrio winogradskyi]|uniref:NADH-flavin reductase n=1 Tax=Thiorhodovibrio winogradskyi TaxID=77007 RepID=A0ABZ0S8J7_9GAMM|nr:NAD(P)H-binding protein [Thiorhodovibrio winogradskyi]